MNASFRTALFGAALATVSLAHADPFTVTVDTNLDLHDGVAVYTYDSDTFYDAVVDNGVDASLAAGTHALLSSANRFNGLSRYTYLAVYDDNGTDGISIGLDAGVAANAIANGTSFEELLGSVTNESDVVSALGRVHSSDPIAVEEARDQIASFVRSVKTSLPRLYSDLTAAPGTMTRFSDATFGGSITGAPVPEPAPSAALAIGGLALLRRRKTV